MVETDKISREEIDCYLATETIGREMEIHGLIDSTNNRAKALAAEGAPHGTAVIAETQSGGKGRLGRSFFSPAHTGIYLSYILRPDCEPERAAMLTSLAAVAAARAIEAVADTNVKIKWVNDLYIGGRKICGILSEAGMGQDAGKPDYVVVGIGINVGKIDFPPELADIATSIGNETGTVPDRNRLIAEISNQMEELYGQLESGAFLEESRRRSNVIGQEITVIDGEKEYPAFAEDIDDQGRLVIRTAEGITRLGYGEVSLKIQRG